MNALHRDGCHYCGAPLAHGNQRICRPCYVERDVAKTAASSAVARAIKAGELRRPSAFSCIDCSGPAIWYDHRDYAKPLAVDPVCRSCNFKRGPAHWARSGEAPSGPDLFEEGATRPTSSEQEPATA